MSEPLHAALRVPPGAPYNDASAAMTADGLPVLLADPERWLAQYVDGEAELALDELPYPAILALARYLPQLATPDAPLRAAVREALRHAPAGAQLAVEVGCSVGPDLRALRAVAAHVIGFDLYLPALRAARAQVDGQPVPWVERIEGRSFSVDEPRAFTPCDGVTLVVGDALDAPLGDATADVVLALNVLDNVADPRLALREFDRMLRPGGLLVLGAPFAWQDAITPLENQLGGAVGAPHDSTPPMLGELLGPGFAIVERSDVPWVLRDHARAEFHYLVHLVAARKLTA